MYTTFLQEKAYSQNERSTVLANNIFGIDLGTNNIKIFNKSDDSIMVEKNMIAIENKKNLFAYGDSAYEIVVK